MSLQEYIKQYYFPPSNSLREPPPVFVTSEVSFAEEILNYVDSHFEKDSLFYEKANISRQAYYKLRTTKNYMPTKSTAFACAVALKLSMEETESLLKKAGMAFSRSSLMDVIVEYYIENGEYDLDKINEVLDDYGQPLLGGR